MANDDSKFKIQNSSIQEDRSPLLISLLLGGYIEFVRQLERGNQLLSPYHISEYISIAVGY